MGNCLKKVLFFCMMGCLIFILFFINGVFSPKEASISFYYYNPCGSCDETARLKAIESEKIASLKEQYPYSISFYNTFQLENRVKYETAVKELLLSQETVHPPLLVLGDDYARGYEEIEKKLQPMLKACYDGK